MLLEILLICSLVSEDPYFDCSEIWTIKIYHSDLDLKNIECSILAIACTDIEKKVIYIPIYYYNYNYQNCYYRTTSEVFCEQNKFFPISELGFKDKCNFGILQHELNHLIFKSAAYCH